MGAGLTHAREGNPLMADSAQDALIAKNEGEAAEAARLSTHSPLAASGGDPGVVLGDAGPGDLDTLGMSADTVVPAVPYGEQPFDYRS